MTPLKQHLPYTNTIKIASDLHVKELLRYIVSNGRLQKDDGLREV